MHGETVKNVPVVFIIAEEEGSYSKIPLLWLLIIQKYL
jgi:hypothetical protein